MAYAACTSISQVTELDKTKQRSYNKIRLAKIEQLELENKLKDIQTKLQQANQKMAETVHEFEEQYSSS